MKTLNDDKSEGVKFYELDDEEEILPNGNEPVPQVTMPTFKKRVHSQRIPQSERAAVTPYEGAYDEKYSSDEENIEYEVCEPEDLTERSNSTITFSEDIYDSDAIDEMLRNQIRKPSQVSQEGSVRSEDMTDGSKPSRGILKGKGTKKGDGVSPGPAAFDEKPPPVSQSKDADKTVSPAEKIAIAGDAKRPESATSGKNNKNEKGEEILEDITKSLQSVITDTVTDKESSVKGEREPVTKPLQSTIPQQIDQITDSSATNKHDFAKSDEKVVVNVTKPLQDTLSTRSDILTEATLGAEPFRASTQTGDPTTKMAEEKSPAAEEMSLKDAHLGSPPPKIPLKTDSYQIGEIRNFEEKSVSQTQGDISHGTEILSGRISSGLDDEALGAVTKDRNKDDQKISKPSLGELKLENVTSISVKEPGKEEIPHEKISPSREDATKRAMELIDDITKKVEEVFPAVETEITPSTQHEDRLRGTSEIAVTVPVDRKTDNCETTQAKGTKEPDSVLPFEKVETLSPRTKENDTFKVAPIESDRETQKCNEATEKVPKDAARSAQGTELTPKTSDITNERTQPAMDVVVSIAKELPPKAASGVAKLIKDVSDAERREQLSSRAEDAAESVKSHEKDHKLKDAQADTDKIPPRAESIGSVVVDLVKDGETVDILTSEDPDPKTGTYRTNGKETAPNKISSDVTLGLARTTEGEIFVETNQGEPEKAPEVHMEKKLQKDSMSEMSVAAASEVTGTAAEDREPTRDGSPGPESKPRVIFRIDSEDELLSDAENEPNLPLSDPSSPTGKLTEKVKQELKETLEKEQMKLEERLSTLKGTIFDISDESLTKTKEIVDERLRKISDIKPPQEVEEPAKKERSPGPNKEVKIGRFHITPALVEEVVSRSREHEIAERLKTTRTGDEAHEEIEKELPEKLTEADLEEVIRELKKEGLKTDVYLQPEEVEKEEKKERTLKRVERRFERMASETLEKDKEEEGISEEKLNEKREIEFQRMVSNLSSDEVAEYQKEYLQLWEEGGLSSLTPTEDWESRDPDTPENELEDDSPKKPESFQGSHGTGKPGTPIKSSEPKKFLKSPTSPPKPLKLSEDISPKAQPLTPLDASHVGSSPSEVDHSSGFVSERSDDIPTYSERKKFWEQMSSSQSSENAGELQRSMIESISSVESVETDRSKDVEEPDKMSVKTFKQKFETVTPELRKTPEEGSVVKSLTESYSKKIAAGELIMPAIPRPKSSISIQNFEVEAEQSDMHKVPDSSDTAVVSELEVKLKSRDSGAPITETAVVSGSTELEEYSDKTSAGTTEKTEKEMAAQESTDSEAEFIAKFGVESVAFDNTVFSEDEPALPLKERKKVFEKSLPMQSSPISPARKSKQERSMSLPSSEPPQSMKMKKKYFEDDVKHETITEQISSQAETQFPAELKKSKIPEIEDAAMIELLSKGIKTVGEILPKKEAADADAKAPKTLNLKETHFEKSETEGSEKVKAAATQKPEKKEEELIPSITVTASGKRQPETASIGESEDTQSESDITPEEARVVDNGDTQWDGSGTHSGGFSPKDDMDYPKEMPEAGIGRWLGQEDLSKPSWEKDDLDSSHYKIHTKWERTRSEGTSPKYVCTPEEHYPDTVWEVPVQEQLEKEEITHDIPIEKQVIIEKDEDEFEDEEEVKVKLTEEEAKDIAEEVLEYIQFEVENRSSFLTNDTEEVPEGLTQAQVSDYLRHLTKGKEFDDQDVKMIENILVKKQRDRLWKSQSEETTACSLDITDEELRSTGVDDDISPVESQITRLQNLEKEDFSDMTFEMSGRDDTTVKETDEDEQRLRDVEIVDKTLAEVKESLEAAQEQLIEQHKRRTKSEIVKKESPSEFELKGMSWDRKIPEAITEQPSDWEREKKEEVHDVKHSEAESSEKKMSKESLKEQTLIKKSHEEELMYTESEKEKLSQRSSKDSSEEEKQLSHQTETTTESDGIFKSENKTVEKTDFDKTTKKVEEVLKKVEVEGKKTEQTDLHAEDKEVQQIKAKEISEKEICSNGQRIQTSTAEEEFTNSLRESKKSSETTTTGDATSAKVSSRLTEISKTESKIHRAVVSESKMDVEELKTLEITVPETMVVRKIGEQICSSEDSPRSGSWEESMKSPQGGEEILSSGSSVDKHGENKSDVLFRHSSSLSYLKADRRSGADLEPYSSSGESHYHSFEQTPSRPCSSDVEVLLAGNIGTTGSSEYESAMSQETSSKQQTSTDYQTAVSSLSSRESMRSLDSESSGHLGSVEVSSEASETLIPSALELDRDIEAPGAMLVDDDGASLGVREGQQAPHRSEPAASLTSVRSADEDFEIISESEVASLGGGASETEEGAVPGEEVREHAQKMKRSYEMTFQPEPKPIAFLDLDGLSKDDYTEKAPVGTYTDETCSIISAPEEKLGSSLEESGSVLSMSLSTTSEPSAMRTVIELSHTDSEKMDGSLTVSATSIDSASREELDSITPQPPGLTNEMSTSTVPSSSRKPAASVTITTSSSNVSGAPCVSTQVTSVSRKSSMADEVKSESDSHEDDSKCSNLAHANGPTQVEYVPDYDEIETTKSKKTQGHRRKESTSNFTPTMMWNLSEARTLKIRTDITEVDEEYGGDKYVYDLSLTEKEVKNDEKKEADDSEGHDQGFEGQERKVSEGEEIEEFKDYDNNRPQSQTSRTDSDSGRRHMSSVFSEDQPDSELSDLMKQGSSETEREDPLERPLSPEPEEMENKDITPEFSSEAQASVTELEMEYSGAYSRRDEYASHVSPIREEKSDAGFKEAITEEYLEEDRVPDGLHSQTSLESTVAEKHELETGEKEILQKKSDLPDITVTEHLTPVSNQKFQYPAPKEEAKEKKSVSKTPDTPASASSRTSSSSTDQGKEYNLDEVEVRKIPSEIATEEKGVSETKDEKESLDSPSSDSFEMLDKPDIADEFVIIEEVGREAQENDQEGKSIKIASRDKMPSKRMKVEQEVIMSPPSPATKMTELKYYPSEEDPDLFPLDSDSPPQAATRKFAEKLKRRSSKEEKYEEYDQQIEQSKKWVEMQFQGEQAAKIMGAYGYEMEFERAPLEDIKEEDINELDSSSKMGSMGSQKESLGSFGSVKDSFSSTPDFDVLAGRKYFTRSGEHDDVSMSSLQEFELIEKKLMENGKKSGSSSSQDSLNSKKLGTSSKSGQGDDVSTGSLKEFETLESACATVVNMEKKAKQEEAILSEIDEGHESQISESESCETVSAVIKEKLEFDSEDFDKKMFEIDEIIRQAQSNVEKFSEMQALEKIESIGRGDSYEEVAKVPDLELDMPFSGKLTTEAPNLKQGKSGYTTPYSTQPVAKKKADDWRTVEETRQPKPGFTAVKQSELLENGGKVKSISADSLEIQTQEKKIILEGKEETISLDSYKRKSQKSDVCEFGEMTHKSDSMEEVRHHDSSSGEYTSSGTDHRPPPRAEFVLGSTDSLDPSSSTATHATYQYETDSVMSSSFTSGDSNTMISSTDNLDLLVSGQSVIDLSKDLGISKTDDWLENLKVGGGNQLQKQRPKTRSEIQKVEFRGPDAEKAFQEYVQGLDPPEEVIEEEVDEHGNVHIKKVLKQRVVIRTGDPKQEGTTTIQHEKVGVGSSEPFISETVETLEDDAYSHVIHKKVQMAPEVEKITFRGPDAEKAMKSYIENLPAGEEVQEMEEVDEHGNIIRKKIIRQRVLIKPGEEPQSRHDVQKITFQGKDPEKTVDAYGENLKTEVIQTQEVGEDGSVHMKRVLQEKKLIRTEELNPEEMQSYNKQVQDQMEIIDIGPQLQKIIIKGPNAEKALEDYAKSLNPEDDVLEMEEIDEHGNIHLKKVLRQRILVRPNKELTKEELEQYLSHLVESEFLEGEGYSHVVQKTFEVPTEVQKVTFKGPDAEKQLQEYIRLQQQQPEVEEIEEVDEQGNTHIKRIFRERVVVRPDRELTKAELQEYLDRLEEPEAGEGIPRVTQTGLGDSTEVQKVTFKGPDAEKQLQEYIRLQQQQPEVEEIEEVDEQGNTHIKRIYRERVVVRPDRELTKAELQEYLNRLEEPEGGPRVTQTGVGDSTEVHKITFKGPDAEKQLQEYIRLQQQQPEVEEIEEVDEHGNVHIKRVIKQRIIIRPGHSAEGFPDMKASDGADKQSRMLTKDELEQYLDQLEETKSGSSPSFRPVSQREGGDAKDIKLVQKPTQPQELSERLLTEEEFQERLRLRQTTFHSEDVYIGSTEPFVTEVIEPLNEEGFSHIIHRKVQMAPEVQKVVFRGPEADRAMKAYVEALNPGEDFEEVEEVDDRGNVHVKRILRRKILLKPEDLEKTGLKGEELKSYLKRFELEHFEGGEGPHVHPRDPNISTVPKLTQGFSSSVVLTEKEGHLEDEKAKAESPSIVGRKESGISQRPPLVSDISMDDEAEYDPTEHDWRDQLEILHAEADEDEIDQNLDAALAASFSSQKKQ